MPVLSASVTTKLDAAGTFKVTLPITDPRTADVQVGRIWQHYQEGQGLVFAGRIENVSKTPDGNLILTGPTLLGELIWENTRLQREYDQKRVSFIIDDLLTGTSWTRDSIDDALATIGWTPAITSEVALAGVAVKPSVASTLPVVDAVSSKAEGPVTSSTYAHVCSGSDRLLVVIVSLQPDSNSVTGITYDGAALTKAGEAVRSSQSKVEIWYRIAPSTGTNNIIVSLSGSSDVVSGGISFTGAHQTTPLGAVASTDATVTAGTLISLAVARNSDDVVVGGIAAKPTASNTLVPEPNLQQYWHLTVGAILGASVVTPRDPIISARFDGESVLKALIDVLAVDGLHMRELVTESGGALTRKLEVGDFAAVPAVTLMGGQPDTIVVDDDNLASVSALRLEETSDDVWNRVIALGAGDGTAQLTLQHSTRTSPYPISSVVGPAGNTIYYISDAASITTYGQRERVMVVKDIAPLSPTGPALQFAADVLYDVARNWLDRWKDKHDAYTVTVRGLPDATRPGDLVRLRFKGQAERWDSTYEYLDIDTNLTVLEITRTWAGDGTETARLLVSTSDRQPQNKEAVTVGRIEGSVRAFGSHIQSYLSQHDNGPILEDVDASTPAKFDIDIHDNVVQLLRCILLITPRAIRSPVSIAASGGGTPTSSSGGSQTPTSSSVSTPSGGGSTTDTVAVHSHQMFLVGSDAAWTDPTRKINYRGKRSDLTTAIDVVFGHEGGATTPVGHDLYTFSGGGSHSHTTPNHTHPSHDHTVSIAAHTHTVAIDHTHGLTFGVVEGGTAAGITIKIDGTDRTSALGGPWSAEVELDITQYLLDASGLVNRGTHAIELGSTGVGRIQVYVHWDNVITAVPV